uniref:Phosphoribosylformylglycinamidine cyclo-ligase n=1 Tax=Caenorhabditis japonica TaxID=281687 RepID=A0A8R1DXP6_CAEJA
MKEYGLPTADFVTIDSVKNLEDVFERVSWKNSVVKTDGLASGKGVIIPKDNVEAEAAARSMLEGKFGDAGKNVIIEERLDGYEVSVLMRLLESDLLDIITSCVHQSLPTCNIKWSHKSVCGVVLASANYPKTGDKGTPITVVTNGGRILCVTSVGDSIREARELANKVAEKIQFNGKQYRKDIGKTLESTTPSLSYGASGVNIDEGNQFVEDIKTLVKKTLLPGASQIGGFGAVLDLKKAGFTNDSQLVVGIDGVGTKIEIATACNNFSGVGYDVVAMCVNDVICHCAKPVAFLDYFVCGKLERAMATQVLASISDACVEAGCSLIGGETAEMPGVYNQNQWDLAGCAIAARESAWPMLPLSSEISEGDVIIGLTSSGLHSNGFSLARKILAVNGVKYSDPLPWDSNLTFGDELLRGTKLYVKSVLPLLTSGLVKGCAHITGGGLTENAVRVLAKNSPVSFVINCAEWRPREIFNWLAAAGPVETKEMIRTLNCGIGMILVAEKSKVPEIEKHLLEFNEEFYEIGYVEKATGGDAIKFLNEETLFNRDLHYFQRQRVKVAILISGTGTNMKKLIERSKTADSNCEVVVVVSNKENAGGLKIAESFGIPTRVVPHTADRVTGDTELAKVVNDFGAELVCLGGYMRILSPCFISQFPSRIINIHPSLLPSFKGANALQDALNFGAKVVGCTAHFVDEQVDHGDIISQRPVMVEDGDTLVTVQKKIQEQEHKMFPNAMIEVAAKILKSKF